MTLARRAVPFAVWSVALFALWMALVDNLHASEIVAGLIAALLCALLATAAGTLRTSTVRLRPAMLRPAPQALLALGTDTLRLGWALVGALAGRPPAGRFRAVPTAAGGDDPHGAARRATTELLASVAPNRYVVGIDTDSGVMLVHELLRSRRPLDPGAPP